MLHVLDRHAIGQILRTKDVDAWGVAANDPRLPGAPDYPVAISMLMRLDPLVVRGLTHGPTHDYHQEYLRVNVALDDATGTLVDVLAVHGHAGRARAGHLRRQPTAPRPSRTRPRPPPPGSAGSARRPCSSRRSSAPRCASPRCSPTSSCRPASRSRRATAATAARASTRARPAAAATCCGGRAWRASSSSTPAPAATTCRSSRASRPRSAASASPPARTLAALTRSSPAH